MYSIRILNKFMMYDKTVLKKIISYTPSNIRYTSYVPVLPKTKYGGRYTITMISGDGYGPQLMSYVKSIFTVAKVPVDFEEVLLNSKYNAAENIHAAVTSIKRNGIAIKGNIYTKHEDLKFYSRNVILRTKLNLFANVLHCKSHPGIKTRHKNVDIILIRQNTEGEYSCLEHESIPGVVQSLKIVTEQRSREIAKFAFEYATRRKRKKITSVHQAAVMPLTDGLFLNTCVKVAKEYPKIEYESIFVGSCCTKMILCPQQFDVLLVPNLYGNILNNVALGLIGGAGIIPGLNVGHECVIFEVGSRSSSLSACPVAMLNASVDLLYYLGLKYHANVIADSVEKTLKDDRILPHDIGGTANANEVINCVITNIKERSDEYSI